MHQTVWGKAEGDLSLLKMNAAARLSRHRSNQRFEDSEALRAAQFRFAGALGMRHHAQDIAPWIANPRDIVERTVGIGFRSAVPFRGAIAKHNSLVAVQI